WAGPVPHPCVLVEEWPVPDPHGGYGAVVPADPQVAGVQQKMLAAARGQPDPARHEHAQHVSVREQRKVAVDRARPGYYPIHSRSNLLRRLAARASIAEEQPARRDLANLLGRQPLVLAVVPLDQVGIDDRLTSEAC